MRPAAPLSLHEKKTSHRHRRSSSHNTHVAIDGGVETKQEPLVAARDDGRHGAAAQGKARANKRRRLARDAGRLLSHLFVCFPSSPPPQNQHTPP